MHLVKSSQLPPAAVAELEKNAGRYWDIFYRSNADRFFRDRHWFAAEFPLLLTAAMVLEVGCGTGATAFPLLELNPAATLYACDFAPTAVEHVKVHSLYPLLAAAGRITAFVADITADDLTQWVPAAGVDACTMIFVLSAISPAAMPAALANAARTLRRGGRILFRDYAAGDLAQARLQAEGRQRKIEDGFYMRGDGTRAYYFEEQFTRALFERAGFQCEQLGVLKREAENKKRGVRMERRFLQGVFVYRGNSTQTAEVGGTEFSAAAAAAAWAQAAEVAAEVAAAGQRSDEVEVTLGQWALQLQVPALSPSNADDSAEQLERSAGAFLARVVLRCSSIFLGKAVVELGCGAAGLPSLAALRWSRRVVATDPDTAALHRLRLNATRNGHLVVIERLRAQALVCGCPRHAARVLTASPSGFDVVLAATPANELGSLHSFFATAASLLAPSRDGGMVLLVCDSGGDVAGGAEWKAAAGLHGLCEATLPPAVHAAARCDASSQDLRLMVFRRV